LTIPIDKATISLESLEAIDNSS